MPARDREAVSRFVERFAAELTEAGMQRMSSRVFSALLASDSAALTSAELAESLRISPAAVSGAIAYLAQIHMVNREREPGSRRDRYRLHNELWFEMYASRDKFLDRFEKTLREGARVLGPDTPAGVRAEQSAEFFAFLQEELIGIMERWRLRQEAAEAQTNHPGRTP
ncbi:MarR family transcriptional regulator [Streptomyces sp. SID3343]|uniref:MarR family transcriptional regulator n=1 Tax=Streptomyces sp. SID3343 TaxID=2690260 RepID=UPI001367C57E|nr:MarR family transcriptional regulator [Streptomyces sp. SID3343]